MVVPIILMAYEIFSSLCSTLLMFAATDKVLLLRHSCGYEATKAIWEGKDGNENEDYQVNPEFAYNNKDCHKDVYDAEARRDCNGDCALMIVVYVKKYVVLFYFLLLLNMK